MLVVNQDYLKKINLIINSYRKNNELYVEPFCGSCAVGRKQNNSRIFNDIDNDLTNFLYNLVNTDYLPPKYLTKEYYYELKELYKNKNSNDNSIKSDIGYASFFGSFGGKKWGGYANDKHGRIYSHEQYIDSVRLKEELKDAIITNKKYTELNIKNAIIYCDPPYINTQKYQNDFDHDEFWEIAKQWSKDNIVLVSERTCPNDYKVLHNFSIRNQLSCKGNRTIKNEYLYLVE